MNYRLNDYKTLIFDCDGVILDSNRVKTAAFHSAALPYGENAARALVQYHISHGGVSRYKKFEYFLEELLSRGDGAPDVDQLVAEYAAMVRAGLKECREASGLEELRQYTSEAKWLVVSGGDQDELREVFRSRELDLLFGDRIFGSPATKEEILTRELASGNIVQPALVLGDSEYDHHAASVAGMDFVFISGWTEFEGWQEHCRDHNITALHSINDLLEYKNDTRMQEPGPDQKYP